MPKSSYISFTNAFVDNSTRADGTVTKENISSFTVWGHHGEVLDFRKVNYQKTASGWELTNSSDTAVTWKTGTYHFHAFSPANILTESDLPQYPAPGKEYGLGKVGYTNNGTTDFVYAYQTRSIGPAALDPNPDKSAVGLTFHHLLSRVKFTFKNNSNQNITISDATIIAPGSASIDLSNPNDRSTWVWSGFAAVKAFEFGGANVTAKSVGAASNVLFLFPSTNDVKLRFLINVPGLDSKEVVITLTAQEFKLGYSYNLIANISDDDITSVPDIIEFTVESVDGWIGETTPEWTDLVVKP